MADNHTRMHAVGSVVGGLGAATAYTSLMSATRGRLDFLSWAFALYVLAVAISILHGRSYSLQSKHQRIAVAPPTPLQYFTNVVFPMVLIVVGTIFLCLSAGLSDPTSAAVAPSQGALRGAVYVTIGFAGLGLLYVIWGFVKPFLILRINPIHPPHLIARGERWDRLPGGKLYGVYRTWSARHGNP
jgi:hypothetical protein